MRLHLLTVITLGVVTVGAFAQTPRSSVPAEIGNRANGLDYQPTPNEVGPRESAAGIAPSATQQKRTDDELWRLDAEALRQEGLSTKSVPTTNGR